MSPDPSQRKLTRRQTLALAQQLARRTSAETAKDFGVSPSAIRMRRHRAKKRLSRQQLEGYKRALGPGRTWRPIQLSLIENV